MRKIISTFIFKINLALVLTFLLVAGPVNAQTFPDGLVGISSDRTCRVVLYRCIQRSATPIVTLNGGASIAGLAFLNRTLYGVDLYDFPGGISLITHRVDINGRDYNVSEDQNGSHNWHGLAADEVNGILYAIDNDNSNILTAQFPNGSVATIGSGAGINGPGMEYDDTHGILYAITFDRSLYTISTVTGTSNLIGPTGIPAESNYIGLAYDECNQILYANDGDLGQLYTLDVTTGAGTLVGSNGVKDIIDGLAWKGRCGSSTD